MGVFRVLLLTIMKDSRCVMYKIAELPVGVLLASILTIGGPIAIFYWLKIRQIQNLLISVLRMVGQLLLVALYLEFVFKLNNIWLNIGWILLMVGVASFSVARQADIAGWSFKLSIMLGFFISLALVGGIFVFIFIQPQPLWDARYMIPVSGMILGNSLRANVVALSDFYARIKEDEDMYITYLTLGASHMEAIIPYMRRAVKISIAPQISAMATLGLVSLPGMMTGQILGGSSPVIAIKYQILIMVAIFNSTCLSVFLNLLLSKRVMFNVGYILKKT